MNSGSHADGGGRGQHLCLDFASDFAKFRPLVDRWEPLAQPGKRGEARVRFVFAGISASGGREGGCVSGATAPVRGLLVSTGLALAGRSGAGLKSLSWQALHEVGSTGDSLANSQQSCSFVTYKVLRSQGQDAFSVGFF